MRIFRIMDEHGLCDLCGLPIEDSQEVVGSPEEGYSHKECWQRYCQLTTEQRKKIRRRIEDTLRKYEGHLTFLLANLLNIKLD